MISLIALSFTISYMMNTWFFAFYVKSSNNEKAKKLKNVAKDEHCEGTDCGVEEKKTKFTAVTPNKLNSPK